MSWKVEIKDKPGIFDAVGQGIKKDISDLGIKSVRQVSFVQVYTISGILSKDDLHKLCEELLVDPISQVYSISNKIPSSSLIKGRSKTQFTVEVAYNPGVMDPVEASILKGASDLGIEGVASVKTSKKYLLKGNLTPAQLKTISEKLLYNKLIQHVVSLGASRRSQGAALGEAGQYQFNLISVDLLGASNKELEKISKNGQLFLNLTEMLHIRDYFKNLRRNPTDCELETLAQTWSEHCGHKTFRGKIRYTEKILPRKAEKQEGLHFHSLGKNFLIDNLLKSTIIKATKELNKPWCVSVFHDNSGVISFDNDYNVCFKVETHNHPSALEPFGGANTGIGGVIRDPLGTGLGAKPVLNTDVFCFGEPDYPFSKLPEGALHPKRIMKGVVSGVRDYGNKMGIPTVNGAVLFHSGFVGNPLVYCGTVGIIPKDKTSKQVDPGDLIVVVGGRTGRDGIHGATFSSGELTHESETISSGAVQIGNPIQEKKMVDTILQARDLDLYDFITDCGAGGLSSAVGEMGSACGARVDLDRVPLKYSGLSYTEIWISESQERMVLSVPRQKIDRLIEVFNRENVEATVIGEFTRTNRLELFYKGNLVCDLEMAFLHDGLPQIEKQAVFVMPKHHEPKFDPPKDLTRPLHKLLSHYNICSKEWIIRQYDHEVQGGAVLKPLAGVVNDGPSDAAVARLIPGSSKGVIISNGINFRFGMIDPYWMAASCIDEALRQVISVGGDLKEVAILDNFCWGNPDKPDRLGGLVRASFGCYDFAKAFGVPFISGKDSLYNEYNVHGKSVAIPGTLLISAIGVMDDISKAVSMYAKKPGDLLYLVGLTYNELGGSHYYELLGHSGNVVPRVYPGHALKTFNALSEASSKGLILAMHDCSEGGIGVAAAEMAFAGGLGMEIFLEGVAYEPANKISGGKDCLRNDFVFFSESNSRFIVEVARPHQKAFEDTLKGVDWGLIGSVSEGNEFKVYGLDGKICVKDSIYNLKESWQKTLRW